ncbi:hypothetical protein [Streptosporangium carneum]|uniref:Lipoprotein n=1 Tax=Streptosporangium carneum TaxID=47481 RepID=A0A9W6I0F3_9ACTN|nr:hypothetical protein [Streptosporangium carneum]GLK08690.1 hypothetical protein GCM10017600_20950 [Streptosporangium carneum]
MIGSRWGAGAAVALVLLGSGCAVTPGPSITKKEAMTVIDGYLQETFRAVPVPSPFTLVRPLLTTSCEYFLDSGGTGQITPGVEYLTESVGEKKARKYLADVAAYWQGRPGVRVEWYIRGDGARDGVEIKFERLGNYWLHINYYSPPGVEKLNVLGGLSDCIWENGTAPPTPDVLDPSFLDPSSGG